MNAIVRTELDNIVKSGPRDEDFKKSQDNILKRHTENLQENVYWLTTLDNYYFRGFNGETAYEETIKGITPAKIQAFARKLLPFVRQGSVAPVEIVVPEDDEAAEFSGDTGEFDGDIY